MNPQLRKLPLLLVVLLISQVSAIDGGYAIFYARGGSVQDTLVLVANDADNLTIDNRWNPDHTNITGQNPAFRQVSILPDGRSDLIKFPDGSYTAYLRQGNGDQPEEQHFVIGGGWTERINFLGAAIPTNLVECRVCENVSVPGEVVTKTIYHPEVNHTFYHPAGWELVMVVDKPAWVETVYHPEVNLTTCFPEVNRTVVHPNTTRQVCDEITAVIQKRVTRDGAVIIPWVTGRCKYYHGLPVDVCEERTFTPCTDVDNMDGYTTLEVISPAHCDTVIDTPAWTEYVLHEAIIHTESVKRTEAWTEIVVDSPAWTETVYESPTMIKQVCKVYSMGCGCGSSCKCGGCGCPGGQP